MSDGTFRYGEWERSPWYLRVLGYPSQRRRQEYADCEGRMAAIYMGHADGWWEYQQ